MEKSESPNKDNSVNPAPPDYPGFKQSVKEAAKEFRKIDKNECVRIVSHLDADGIAAASIMINALGRENMKYSISIVQQLSSSALAALSKESYNYYIFTDLGSGNLQEISEILKGKTILVLDHHEIKGLKDIEHGSKITVVNPAMFGIDGGIEISGSGVVYMFAKELNSKNSNMAHLAVIGAIGDIQEKKGFLTLNNEILEDAKKEGLINPKEGLRVFGAQTRPLYKVLEYCSDPYIPGVTGSESSAIQFLNEIGIKPQEEGKWRKFIDLSDDEMKKLIVAVIMKRSAEPNPEDVIGYQYILANEEEECSFRDAKEFSTLLNACGRLNKASLGIGACLGDKKIKKKALQHQDEYKRQIVNTMNWYRDNKDNPEAVKKEKGFVMINAQDNIISTMIGTMLSMLSKSKEFKEGTLMLGMAQAVDNTTKISLRVAGHKNEVDLTEVMKEIVERVGGEAGGHMNAAGAVIPTTDEGIFMDAAIEVLKGWNSRK